MDFFHDMLGFIKERKKYWLVPLIFILLILGLIIVVGGKSSLAPFIYTIF